MNVASSNTPEAGIFNFHSELLKLLGRGHISLLALQEMDFPGGFQHTQTESLKLQQSVYRWSKDFLEASKKRLCGDTMREANSDEVVDLRKENTNLK